VCIYTLTHTHNTPTMAKQIKQEVVQRIQHPRGAWAVVAITLPDGSIELATACHDGFVRVFTRDPAKYAAEGVRIFYKQR
jgi:hypothetical protein